MPKQSLPDACPKCRGSRLVRILWRYWRPLGDEAAAELANKRAILGLNHSWFTSADPTLVAGKFFAKEARLPRWACLDCAPQWLDVHRLASAELEHDQDEVLAAIDAGDYERAAGLQRDRRLLITAHVAKFERLLRELVGSE